MGVQIHTISLWFSNVYLIRSQGVILVDVGDTKNNPRVYDLKHYDIITQEGLPIVVICSGYVTKIIPTKT